MGCVHMGCVQNQEPNPCAPIAQPRNLYNSIVVVYCVIAGREAREVLKFMYALKVPATNLNTYKLLRDCHERVYGCNPQSAEALTKLALNKRFWVLNTAVTVLIIQGY